MQADALRVAPELGPVGARPGSLAISDDFDFRSNSALDSYSPFPTFPGSSRSRDPYGLNAFLLSPHDRTWDYLNPVPLKHEQLAAEDKARPADDEYDQAFEALEPAELPPPRPPRSKRRSSSVLRRPSPLASNPPLSAEEKSADIVLEEDEDRGATPLAETSSEEASPAEDAAAELNVGTPRRPLSSGGTKGLRAIIGRKSAIPQDGERVPDKVRPASQSSSTQGDDESSPATTRSQSMSSLMSTSSSEVSCDGVQTPRDGSPLDVNAAAARLTALSGKSVTDKTGDKQSKKGGGWRGWLGGRRVSFLGLRGEPGTPLLESPLGGVIDLTPDVPDKSEATTVMHDAETAQSAEALRRLSLSKLGSLRMPSPHPLALLLTRQDANLPDEVAFSIPATKRVFPKSVNVVQRPGAGASELSPSQGGLRLALAVRDVIRKIDTGEAPRELFLPRREPRQSTIMRPRGARDFVSRPPFEERMVVFDDNGGCAQVSMARHNFAIYDLEYSDYIVTLSEVEDLPVTWSSKQDLDSSAKRISMGPPVLKVTNPDPPAKPTMSKSASSPNVLSRGGVRPTIDTSRGSGLPKSSFRRSKVPTTWDDSSDEEALETPDEEPFDDPKNRLVVPPVKMVPTQQRPASHRMSTAPNRARESRLIQDPSAALAEVQRVRERRERATRGEPERMAESQARRMSQLPSSTRISTYSLNTLSQPERRPSHRSSSMSLATKPRMEPAPTITHRKSSATLAPEYHQRHSHSQPSRSGHQTPTKHRPTESLPASPRSRPQSVRYRIPAQPEPPMPSSRSVMSMSMYGAPAMPVMVPAPVYAIPPAHPVIMPHPASMLYHQPQLMPNITGHGVAYQPQFPALAQVSHRYSVVPQPQYNQPIAGRRRERPVS